MNDIPFYPAPHATVSITTSSSSQSVKLIDERGPFSVRIMNQATATVWIAAGDSTVTASSSVDIPIPAGAIEIMTFNNSGNGPLYVAAIAGGSLGNISFTPGRGY